MTDSCPADLACTEETCLSVDDPCAEEFACGLSDPCGATTFVWDTEGAVAPAHPDRVECILEALRDGQGGTYRVSEGHGGFPAAQQATHITIQVLPSRVALVTERDDQDLNRHYAYRGPVALRDPSYFEACLAETDHEATLDCLQDATLGCAP